MRFGLFWDSLSVDSGSIKSGQTLSTSSTYGLHRKAATLVANSKDASNIDETRGLRLPVWTLCLNHYVYL